MKTGMRKTTTDRLRLVLDAILDSDCIRDKGLAFSEMKSKTIDAFRSKLHSDKKVLNLAIMMYCTRYQIPWRKDYSLDNICKTSRQFNYLANELMYYITKAIPKSLEPRMMQMEFKFTDVNAR